jgi:hypothetical protein
MTSPAVRQQLSLDEEINQREAEQDFATQTALAAVAREKVLQSSRHTAWAAIGVAVGLLGFVGFLLQMMSTGLAYLLSAVGIASAMWLLTDRRRRHTALSRAQNLEVLARSARRHLDDIHSHIFMGTQLPKPGNSPRHRVSGLAISRVRLGDGWRHPHRASGQRWVLKQLIDVTGWRFPRHTHRGSAADRHLGFSMSPRH